MQLVPNRQDAISRLSECHIGKFHSRWSKLGPRPRPVLPVTEKRRKLSTPSSSPLGANDEYFRKNHERDLRHQGRCCPSRRRRGRRRCKHERSAAAATVDVAPILDAAVKAKKEKLEWRTSIVDLMKALDINSSFNARKELAKELGYTGDSKDSASMNIWLHKQVMAKLAANGGKLPPELKD